MTARRPDRDAGFTLPELVVTMMVAAVVLTIVGTLFANVAKYTGAASSSRDAMAQAALAVDEVGAVVRTASDQPTGPSSSRDAVWSDPTHRTNATSLWITAFSETVAAAPQPALVHFSFRGADGASTSDCLLEDRYLVATPGAAYPDFSGAHTSRCIAGSSANPFVLSGDPFFTYLDAKGGVIPITGGQLTATQLPLVTFVVVTPVVHKAQGLPGSDTYVLSSAVGMPNIPRDVAGDVSVPTVPTDTPSPPASPSPTYTDPPSPSDTPTDTPSASSTDSPSDSPSPSPTDTPSASATATPSPSATPSAPSTTPTASPSPDPTSTP